MSTVLDKLAYGTTRHFQPSPIELATTDGFDSEIQKRLAFLVGMVAIFMPVILVAGSFVEGSCLRFSLSHFYYDRLFGTVFVGMLVFIAGFLLAYTGDHVLEDKLSTVAGVMAAFVAFFPTTGWGCRAEDSFTSRVFANFQDEGAVPQAVDLVPGSETFHMIPGTELVHGIAAGVLFTYLGLYCLIVLRRIVEPRHVKDGKLLETKRRRNILYAICGIVILACVAILLLKLLLSWAGLWNVEAWNDGKGTLIVETIALWAFGTAWLAKGRRFKRLNEVF